MSILTEIIRRYNMSIQKWSENIILVNLSPEPELGEDLQSAICMAVEEGGSDVVVDFSDADIITSSSIAKMLKLRKVLVENDRRLVFCCVSSRTKNVFSVAGLENVFEFVDDQFVALAGLQMAGDS
jgi:anti-anti-sigma factor